MSGGDIVGEKISKIFYLNKKDENTFVGKELGDEFGYNHVYGGYPFAQSMLAAQKTVGPQFIPHSLHSFFLVDGELLFNLNIILNINILYTIIYFSLSIETNCLQNTENP